MQTLNYLLANLLVNEKFEVSLGVRLCVKATKKSKQQH